MVPISGQKLIQEIAADHARHPIKLSRWKSQQLDNASDLYTRGKQSKDKEEVQAHEADLFQQIGKLQMELEWLHKNHNCLDAHELRKLVDLENLELTTGRQCVNRRCGSWPGSTSCIWRIHGAAAGKWCLTWPEKGSTSASTSCETSWAARDYVENTRRPAPWFHGYP